MSKTLSWAITRSFNMPKVKFPADLDEERTSSTAHPHTIVLKTGVLC